jgi:hypothetical protein
LYHQDFIYQFMVSVVSHDAQWPGNKVNNPPVGGQLADTIA